MKPKILFNKAAVPFILKVLDQETTEDGYLYHKDTLVQTLYPDGEQVNVDTMAGVIMNKDKPLFIKNDLFSIMEVVDNYLLKS